MEPLKIDARYDTPKVTLDKATGVFEICGRSIPEDADEFYQPVVDWIENYARAANENTRFVFKLDYLNTSSTRMIQNILLAAKTIDGVTIEWLYKEDDQDMEEAGEDFAQLVEFPIEVRMY